MTLQPGKKSGKLPRHSAALAEAVLEKNPVHRKVLESAIAQLPEDEIGMLESYISYCLGKGLTLDYLAESYLTIVMDTFREQMYFRQHGKYRYSSFAEVAGHVYFDRDYMAHYMYGLAITGFFWPNHQAIMSFFRETLPRNKGGKYLEIGPGHGFFFMTAMALTSYDEFEGVDISQTSVEMTREILDFYQAGKGRKFDVALKDFLKADIPGGSCSSVVMGEVLEHVERPDIFLRRIAEIAKHDAYIFITTCCNAPAVDHIYLFRNAGEVEKLFADSGLIVKKSLILPMTGQTMEKCEAENLPVNVAYVLGRT
jgi:2-polyprenyl-3-methyl-5-hydroxy-6-metoxy-1,4-benzoquinol methylase